MSIPNLTLCSAIEISLSAIQPHSPETAAAEYFFSLDVGADAEEAPADLLWTLSPAAVPALVTEPERTLEGGWVGLERIVGSGAPCFSSIKIYLISATFSHQLQKSKHHEIEQ